MLACAEGLPNARVADDLGVSREMVRKWRARFVATGPSLRRIGARSINGPWPSRTPPAASHA
ncbi:helix-turn-helix domain-containing protein [Streptomyces sp. NPDC059402]|uniref:helix-turn-helix domain-containing protein n=1 Tax=Streptomyces sp. NPDC059402 TaxID=3346822 RepID=UPI00369EB661